MKKQHLTLYKARDKTLRTVFKNNHGRIVFLALKLVADTCIIIDHYYTDRTRNGKFFAVAQRLKTRTFPFSELQTVIANELDRDFDFIKISTELSDLSNDDFICHKLSELNPGYKFLIFIGEGELVNNIPSILKTRFKNRIHRSIYLEIRYVNGRGVISDCHYYDRKYKARTSVTPEMLTTVYFEYNRQTLLNIINSELNTAFTDILFINDGSIDISRKTPLCGYIT